MPVRIGQSFQSFIQIWPHHGDEFIADVFSQLIVSAYSTTVTKTKILLEDLDQAKTMSDLLAVSYPSLKTEGADLVS